MPTIVALLHDLLITVGVYSLTGREVTSATVAAVLTILGYSLYDTIIVFDRVRENTPLLRKNSYGQIVNISLWETLTRSMNTSLITLCRSSALFIFGGDTLKDFAFALLIGIASGAYSSIFIAAPLLALLKEREPEYRRLRGSDAMVTKATLGTPVGSVGTAAPAPQPARGGRRRGRRPARGSVEQRRAAAARIRSRRTSAQPARRRASGATSAATGRTAAPARPSRPGARPG